MNRSPAGRLLDYVGDRISPRDAPGFAGNVETAYRDMWRRWCRDAQAGHTEDRREAVGT